MNPDHPMQKHLVDLYVYQRRGEEVEFLLLKRAKRKIYSGQWRMIGGKVHEGETRWEAALRELREETQLIPRLFWSVPTINHFYEARTDAIHLIPAFAAEVDPGASIRLDDEHLEYRWVPLSEVKELVQWPEQKRIMELIRQIVSEGEILEEWKISVDPA